LLAAQLVECGHEVRYPALPEPDAPQLERWLDVLDEELAALGGEQRVVVCHSLACLLWFRAAERGLWAGGAVDRLLLVSPPGSECLPDGGASFGLEAFDADAVRASVNGEIAIACSDADPYNPASAQALYGDALGITATVFEGAGHITLDTGFGRWPFASDCAWPPSRSHDESPFGALRSQRDAGGPRSPPRCLSPMASGRARVAARCGRTGDGRHPAQPSLS